MQTRGSRFRAWSMVIGLALAWVAFGSAALAADPQITGQTAVQRAGTKLVDITYTLTDADSPTVSVSVEVSTNNGVSYTQPATSFSGSGYGPAVTPGTGKQIVWDAGADWNGQYSAQVWFRLTATDGGSPSDDYMVIDLSGGPSASSYPVSYLDAVPSGGWTEEHKTTKLVMRKIPAGTYTMGSPYGELGRYSDETQHQVTLTKDFYIGVFEVTQKQWERVMGTWPSYFNNATYRDSRPVEQVSYYDIRENPDNSAISPNWPQSSQVHADSFMGKLRAKTGLTTLDMPTESQGEYACRAGTTTALNSDKNLTDTEECPNLSEVGRYWFNGGSGYSHNDPGYESFPLPGCEPSAGTAAVGSSLPNQWGLYDMHGNVWEWCLDWYDTYPGTVTDPGGAASGSYRVLRGGSWYHDAWYCRSAHRNGCSPLGRGGNGGFRITAGTSYAVSCTAVIGPVVVNTRGASPGTLQFTAAATNVTDGMRSLTMTVTRTSGTAGPASVKYATANGNAIAGTDYTATSGTLNWADGNAEEKTFQIQIMSRPGLQGDRSFQVKLSAAVGASVAAPGTSTVTIVDAGVPPAAPTGASASDGTFNDKVRVTWTAAATATGYQVRRNTSNNPGGATQVGAPAVTTYDDTTAKPGVTYYYWVRAVNEYGTSADSAGDSGYAALPGYVINDYDGNGISELAVYDNNIGSWYAYSLQTGQAPVWNRSWGWPGAETVPGDYDGDAFSDMAVYDQNTGYWYVWSEVKGRALLWERPWGWPGAETVYGDYDGDAKSDLAVYDQPSGFWYIITMDDRVLAWDRPWGWTGAITVPGDYNGDRVFDLSVYDQNTGYWFVQTLADPSSSLAWAQPWGWPGATTVPGDYDADGNADMAVYDQPTGAWYVWSQAKQKALIWARPWGWTGAVPVPGDYDGDKNADLAVFDTITGHWYIWSEIKGKALAWAQNWGWPGANPPGGRE